MRHYEGSEASLCFNEDIWGLVALHIIQKTELAPYFIYATFEQADNIRDRNGNPVEDDDGRTAGVECRPGQSGPCPRTPNVALVDDGNPMNSPKVEIRPAGDAYCSASIDVRPPNQLYYLNKDFEGRQPIGGYICVNGRANPIPLTIVTRTQRRMPPFENTVEQTGSRALHGCTTSLSTSNISQSTRRNQYSFLATIRRLEAIPQAIISRTSSSRPTRRCRFSAAAFSNWALGL